MRFTSKPFYGSKSENLTDHALLLVAFPELEATPFSMWLRSVLAVVLAPIRNAIEILLVDSSEVIRGIFSGHR